jgi:SAM-dependent methyltransferase
MPDVPLFRFDLNQCPLPAESIDAIVMLNVLEHIRDEERSLRQVHRILKPGGICVMEVPAGPNLYDYSDEYLRHFRRYTERGLIEACEGAGLSRVTTSHLGFLLYPAFYCVKKRNRQNRPPNSQEAESRIRKQIAHSRANMLIDLLMRCEVTVAEVLGITYRAGIRCVGVFRKGAASVTRAH